MKREDRASAIIGSILGLALAGYFFVYAPMKRNHDECGRVTLCSEPAP